MKYLLLIVILFASCKEEDRSLEAVYMLEGTMTSVDIHCKQLEKNRLSVGVRYLETDNDEFMGKFATSYDKLQPKAMQDSHDIRIRLFYHHGEKTDTICMGELTGIVVNGQQIEDSPELLALVKSKIYK